jgi:acyl-CoA synthetase (AMP-forming)/AMP-acid ligase II
VCWVRRLATALTAPRGLGGLEILPQGKRVAILSEGNVVRIRNLLILSVNFTTHKIYLGLPCYSACLYSGITFVLLNCHWTHEELGRALTLSEPTHIFASAALIPRAISSSTSVRATLGAPIQIHALSNNHVSPECFDIAALIARTINIPEIPVCPVRRDMLAVSPPSLLVFL